MATQQADERKPAHGNFIGGRAIQYRKAPRNARTQVWLKRALQLIATTAAGGFLDRFEFDVNLDPSVIGFIPSFDFIKLRCPEWLPGCRRIRNWIPSEHCLFG